MKVIRMSKQRGGTEWTIELSFEALDEAIAFIGTLDTRWTQGLLESPEKAILEEI